MTSRVKQVEGLAAVLSAEPGEPDKLARGADLSATELEELRTFAAAGWQIVPKDKSGPEQRRVYRDDAGHVLIEGQYLTLRTNPGVSPEEVKGIAEDYGLAIHRTLGLRRNMFQVETVSKGTERPDPLEICAKLEEDDRVKWADPSFIEAIGERAEKTADGD